MNQRGRHLLLYDGVCGLCDRLVQLVLARDRGERFDFASLQSPAAKVVLGRFARDPDTLNTLYVVADYRTGNATLLSKSQAVLMIGATLGWPWKAVVLLRVLPGSLLDWGYDLVARHRYRVFGRYDQCLIPRPEHRARFVESDEAIRSNTGRAMP